MNNHYSTKIWQNANYFLAFGFGTGALPVAPGTWGSIVAIPLFLLMSSFSLVLYITVVILLFLWGIKICDEVSRELGVHDFSGIVWDEVVGMLITLIAVPVKWQWVLIGFLLFRLFDIWKPFPINWIDRKIQGGLGIMLDDALAAIPSWLILQLLVWSFGR